MFVVWFGEIFIAGEEGGFWGWGVVEGRRLRLRLRWAGE